MPRIKCREQQVLMSKYHWETDKIKDAKMTLGDGGDIEEVCKTVEIFLFGITFIVAKQTDGPLVEFRCSFTLLFA